MAPSEESQEFVQGHEIKSTGKNLSFQPSARLQRYLGKELIADPGLAVLEFVKNGFDAGASRVTVNFILGSLPTRLIIADDGIGMDLDGFTKNWMRPGFSSKSPDAPLSVREKIPSNNAGKRLRTRTQTGEKGLGRLSAARLGDFADIYTRTKQTSEWLHVHVDWSTFDDMTANMSDIKIPYEFVASVPESVEPLSKIGTVVQITNLNADWSRRLPGRQAVGRSSTRLGRLKQDLELLLLPLESSEREFQIDFQGDQLVEEGIFGEITTSSASESADYVYDFEFYIDDKGNPKVKRSFKRSRIIAEQFSKKRQENSTVNLKDVGESHRPSDLSCGPFSGRFLYNPPPANQRARAESIKGHGVLLYRDGVIVEPYGLDDNDWLGVEAKKAQRQGHALVQPSTFWGEVEIHRAENRELVDMANRQGLLESAESSEFIAQVRAEFEWFERMVTAELEGRWVKPEEAAAKGAEIQLRAIGLLARSYAHHLRQPIMGIDTELLRLERVANTPGLPQSAKAALLSIHSQLQGHLERAQHLVDRYAARYEMKFEQVNVNELFNELETEVRSLAGPSGVTVNFKTAGKRTIVLPKTLIVEALVELITNAIEVERPKLRTSIVTVNQHMDGRELIVEISDNGHGMGNKVAPGTALEELDLRSTRGRQGEGLRIVAALIAYVRGHGTVTKNSSEGTTIVIRIPGGVAPLDS